MIEPPIYPWSAFDDRRFLLNRRLPVYAERYATERVVVHSTSDRLRDRLLSEFDRAGYETIGVLRGEYAVAGNGLMLFDRARSGISINFAPEISPIGNLPYQQANDPELRANRDAVYGDWDSVPILSNAAVFSHIYHSNYYHFTFELAQKFRHLEEMGVETVLMPDEMLNAPFKRDLVERARGRCALGSLSTAVRVRDPVVVQSCQSHDAIAWLRTLYAPNAAPCGRKVYIRRSPAKARLGNNIAETPAFQALLAAHGFDLIDFGNGENSLQDQIHMLDGASVILSAHGAGLTNLAYLRGPLRVIEVFGPAVLTTPFIRISAALGFEHHAVISPELDGAGDILVDCDLLQGILGQI